MKLLVVFAPAFTCHSYHTSWMRSWFASIEAVPQAFSSSSVFPSTLCR